MDPNSVTIPHQGAALAPGGVTPFVLWPWDLNNPSLNGLGSLEGFLSLPASLFARIFNTSWAPNLAVRGGWDPAFPPDQEGLPQNVSSIPALLAMRATPVAAQTAPQPVATAGVQPVAPADPAAIMPGVTPASLPVTPVTPLTPSVTIAPGITPVTPAGVEPGPATLAAMPLPAAPQGLVQPLQQVADVVARMANPASPPGGQPLLQAITQAVQQAAEPGMARPQAGGTGVGAVPAGDAVAPAAMAVSQVMAQVLTPLRVGPAPVQPAAVPLQALG